MQDNVAPPRLPKGRTQTLFETAVNSGFDQIIKGDVIIKKLKNKHEYRITFSKVYGDRFFFYQVFNKDNTNSVNDQRFAAYITTKNYINVYNFYNDTSNIINKLVFTPTTIMELSNFSKYAFVINRAYFNSYKRLVFIVSTKEINLQNNTSKKLTQIPSGKFKHVRFDIDVGLNYIQISLMSFESLWNYINKTCTNDAGSMQTFGGKDYRLCDENKKQLPDIPDVCKNLNVLQLTIVDSPCTIQLRKMVESGSFPETINYIVKNIGGVDNPGCKCLKGCPFNR